MRIITAKDYNMMSRKAANIIGAQVRLKPNCVLGLATGSTPIGLYKCLIDDFKLGLIDFANVKTINLDEYVGLPTDNDQSYAYFMTDNLFSHINIDKANTNVPNGLNPDAEGECARYDALIEAYGGMDIQLLGLGHNGHIGFNEPADSFVPNTNCVDLTKETIDANARFFASADEVPKKAYTMGIRAIMRSKKILLVANGEGKANILYNALFGPITPQVPASILQLHKNVIVVADEVALSVIAQKEPNSISIA